ncbi:D-alanyl-D-alanine carboxypeptidase family protein [Rhodobacteraceae bacterium nBUS_24]
MTTILTSLKPLFFCPPNGFKRSRKRFSLSNVCLKKGALLLGCFKNKKTEQMNTGIKTLICCILLWLHLAYSAASAPYSAIVIEANTNQIVHYDNAEAISHPAGLTKLATLYVALAEVEAGNIGLDTMIRISRKATEEADPTLGLREGQRMQLRYLIRAAAVRGANDAATALAEGIAGSESAFAEKMNQMARELGLTQSSFRNAHGLTESGQYSTAKDMAKLFLALERDFKRDFLMLGKTKVNAKIKTVKHSGQRLLNEYPEAVAVKTGYTRAAGFCGAMYAKRGQREIIVVMFGGRSTATRNAQMMKLAELGFKKAK